MDMTPFSKRCEILSELWLEHRDIEEFEEFIEYNDLGLPMAHLINEKLVEPTRQGEIYIDETFDLFLTMLGLKDEGFDSLDELFEIWRNP
jgi:hypothetical protein